MGVWLVGMFSMIFLWEDGDRHVTDRHHKVTNNGGYRQGCAELTFDFCPADAICFPIYLIL